MCPQPAVFIEAPLIKRTYSILHIS
uniref:Uncharacterized protein n=1 Tax=Anguilla anguilla TaxID=7936 RepID=A0A0E9RLZ1_ANGAN